MNKSLFFLFVFLSNFLNASPTFRIGNTPNWVFEISEINTEVSEDNYGFQYLLIDRQYSVARETYFSHTAYKILNADGLQDMSTIDIDFDPTYQRLVLHEVSIRRGDKLINQLFRDEVEVLQREKSMERSLYDGAATALIHLSDVRVNDVVEYSYSIEGFNPIMEDNFYREFSLEYGFPINRIFYQVQSSPKDELNYFNKNTNIKPHVIEEGDRIVHTWDVQSEDVELYENNVPSWYDIYAEVRVSNFTKWSEVVEWAVPLYKYNAEELKEATLQFDSIKTTKGKILQMIRMVQDDVRYLGFESGIGGYKPNSPSKVYKQRYGDCKDKSLLLSALLQGAGVEAYPLLVNTVLESKVEEELPSPNAFDHCVVQFEYNDKKYFVDPTISNQGGALEDLYFPSYGFGLLIKSGENQLKRIGKKIENTVSIVETITVSSIGGDAEMVVVSKYTGYQADIMRSTLDGATISSLQKNYLNFYSELYPGIESTYDMKFNDSNRDTNNELIVTEYYRIEDFWMDSDDSTYIFCETYPMVLNSMFNYPNSAKREMPYFLGEPFKFSQTTNFRLPERWGIEPTKLEIEEESFRYSNSFAGVGNEVNIKHEYELLLPYIEGADVSEFLSLHEKIKSEFSYILTYDSRLSEGFQLSAISLFIAILSVILGGLFAIKVYRNFDPAPVIPKQPREIGGWLILPAIALVITPFRLLFTMFIPEHFNAASWDYFFTHSVSEAFIMGSYFGAEIVYNIIFLIFSVLLLILFFQKRSNVPLLISIFYIAGVVVPLVDAFLAQHIFDVGFSDGENRDTAMQTVRGVVAAAIWIPYFNISQRSKETFVKTFAVKKELETVEPSDDAEVLL